MPKLWRGCEKLGFGWSIGFHQDLGGKANAQRSTFNAQRSIQNAVIECSGLDVESHWFWNILGWRRWLLRRRLINRC